MTEYSLRRLRCCVFSLYNICKDCVKTSEYIENLSKIKASTLYDLVKYQISIDTNDLVKNFICLVLKCIIVHLENVNSGSKENVYQALDEFQNFKIASNKDKNGMVDTPIMFLLDRNSKYMMNNQYGHFTTQYNSAHFNFHEPTLFFNSHLGTYIKRCCGMITIINLLQNHRVLIPYQVCELSRTSLFTYILELDEFDIKYKTLMKIFKSISNSQSKRKCNDSLSGRKTYFLHCSGSILTNRNIKACEKVDGSKKFTSKWSKMVIYRNFIFLKSKTKNRRAVYKTIFDSLPTDDETVMELLCYIIFNEEAFSQELKVRRASVNSLMLLLQCRFKRERTLPGISNDDSATNNQLVESYQITGINHDFCVQKTRKRKRKTVLYGLFTHFKRLVNNLQMVDWYDTSCLVSRKLKGSNFSTVDVSNVYKYVKNIVERTVTPELLCGKSNYSKFLKLCYSIITLNKGENPSMAELMKCIKIRECVWTKGIYHSRGQTRTILEYLCRLIFFLLQYLVIPAIGRHLHITESGFSKYRVYYIRNEEWTRMVRAAKEEYMYNGKICDESQDGWDFPKIRFVPKHKGMRPILNCNTRAGCKAFYQSLFMNYDHNYKSECQCYICYVYYQLTNKRHLNSVLRKIHKSLTANSRIKPIMGNGVMGYNSFYRHLKSWWIKFMNSLHSVEDVKLYYFIADLSRCYERIPHDKLMEVLNGLPLMDSTMCVMHKRFIVKLASGVNSFSKLEDVSSLYMPKMNHLSSELYGKSIITSNFISTRGSKVTKFDIVSAVSALIGSLKLQLPNSHNKEYMKLSRGIPQGCCISPFLSNLYLSCLDKNLISSSESSFEKYGISFTLPNLLVRWIDDFLFISTNRDDVNSVSNVLRSNNMGAVINLNKVFTNADNSDYTNDFNNSLYANSVNTGASRINCGNCDGAIYFSGTSTHYGKDGINHSPYINSNAIEWINCRFNFDIKNRYIDVEIVPWKFPDVKIRDSICLSRGRSGSFMFTFIEQRLLGVITNKLEHKTYTCTIINSPLCITSNAYTVMRLCSLKLRCAMQVLTEHFGGFINLKYIFRLILNLVTITLNLVANGGMNIRENHLRDILIISCINSFKHKENRLVKYNRKYKCMRLTHRRIANMLYRQIESCVNRGAVLKLASQIECKYKSTWSTIL